jgi:flagellar brake protein
MNLEEYDSMTAAEPSLDESTYLLHSPLEIAHVLRDIMRRHSLTTIHFDAGHEVLLTALLAIDPATNELVFDASGNARLNQAVLAAPRLLFFSNQDKIKVRFVTARARVVRWQGRDAFAVAQPKSLLRLQRRENYRLLAPVAHPVKCVIPVAEENGQRAAEARLHDIGLGGVGLIMAPAELPVMPGMQWPNCRIVLPESGNVIATLEVRFAASAALSNRKTVLRVGCVFVRPSMAALTMVQRYMLRLERAKRTVE